MKKKSNVKAGSLVLAVCIIVTSCGFGSEYRRDEDAYTEKILNTITTAGSEDDVDAIYALFAPVMQESESDLEDEIQEFVDYFDGEFVSATPTYFTESETTHEEHGYKIKVNQSYDVVTTENEYEIAIVFYPEAYDDNYLGICSLGIQTEEDLSQDGATMYQSISGAYVVTADNRDQLEERAKEYLDE